MKPGDIWIPKDPKDEYFKYNYKITKIEKEIVWVSVDDKDYKTAVPRSKELIQKYFKRRIKCQN